MRRLAEIGTEVVPDQSLLIDGERVAGRGEAVSTSYPATLELLAEFGAASPAQLADAVGAARHAFDHGPWPRLPVSERALLLAAMADHLQARLPELARLVGLDNGKTLAEQPGDVLAAIGALRAAAAAVDVLRPLESEVGGLRRTVHREPVGVVAAITPYNAPLMFCALKAAPALVAGNTVVLKPSPRAPLTPFLLAEAAVAAGLPPGVFNLVQGGPELGLALSSDPRVDMITITAGTTAGSAVMAAAAAGIRKPLLELGGKSAQIVFADADLELAAAAVLGGIFKNSGQRCFSGSRLLVERSVHDRFLAAVVRGARHLVQGDPFDPATQVGAMVDEEAVRAVESFLAAAISDGAELACGGGRPQLGGAFFQPTVLVSQNPGGYAAQEECFGPVLTVLGFEGEEEAVAIANHSRYGLAGSCWTGDPERAVRVARAVRTGYVWINTYAAILGDMPFGGYKASGLGREAGHWGIEEYTELKSVITDPTGHSALTFK